MKRVVACCVIAAFLLIGVVLAALRVEHFLTTEIPKPRGPFDVGRVTFDWTNLQRVDELSPSRGAHREVVAWIWYPAARTVPGRAVHLLPAEYQPAPWRAALGKYAGVVMTGFLTRDTARVRANSTQGADVSAAQPAYPVIILRAGGGALTTDFTTLAEDLASRGYVVVGFDAPYRSVVFVGSGGRVILRPRCYNLELLPTPARVAFATRLAAMWSGDIGFVLDQLNRLNSGTLAAAPAGMGDGRADARDASRFAGRLDLTHVGIAGHSLGGATAAQFCHDDARCTAGADLDGALFGPVVREGLERPFLFLLSDHGESLHTHSTPVFADIRAVFARLPPDSRLLVTLHGSHHFAFSDQILLKSQWVIGALRVAGFAGGLDSRRGLAAASDYLDAFFDVHLKGRPPAQIETVAQRYPESRLH